MKELSLAQQLDSMAINFTDSVAQTDESKSIVIGTPANIAQTETTTTSFDDDKKFDSFSPLANAQAVETG